MKIKITIEVIRRVKQKKEVWNGDQNKYFPQIEVVDRITEIYSQTMDKAILEEKGCTVFDVIKAFNGEK